jgi:hypothetical protein
MAAELLFAPEVEWDVLEAVLLAHNHVAPSVSSAPSAVWFPMLVKKTAEGAEYAGFGNIVLLSACKLCVL